MCKFLDILQVESPIFHSIHLASIQIYQNGFEFLRLSLPLYLTFALSVKVAYRTPSISI